jgi:hypothetical protein
MTKIADWVGIRAEELLQSMKRESYDLRHQERELEAAWDNWDWDTLESYGLITKADYQFVQKFLGEYGDTGWETRGRSARGRRARGRRAYRVPVGYVEVKTARVDYTGEEDDGLLIGYSQSGEELWRIHEASTLNPDDDSGEWLLEDVTTGHPIKWFSNSTSAEEHAKGLIYEIEE